MAAGRTRQAFGRWAAFRAALRRFAVPQGFSASATLVTVNPYAFHLGLAVVVFGYAPHIAFIQRLTGLASPALPDGVAYAAAGAAILSLLLALMFRLADPVLRMISGAVAVLTQRDAGKRRAMSTPHWEHFDHGADIGVRGFGCTRAEAFEQAALALTGVITDPLAVEPRERRSARGRIGCLRWRKPPCGRGRKMRFMTPACEGGSAPLADLYQITT